MASDAEWRDVLLEDLAASTKNAIVGGPFGSDLVSSDYSPTGVPVIRGENLSVGRWVAGDFVFVSPEKAQKLSANTAGALDIVFTQRGANHYRQVAVVRADADGRFVVSQSQMKVTVDQQKADPLFVYYLFRSPIQQEYLQRNAIQTGVPHTNFGILRKVPFRIPSLSIQRAIVRVLGALDDKIDLNRRMNETLEKMARAIFKDWFVDFGPTRAKMEGRPPYLSPELWSLFPEVLGDEGKPKGWVHVELGDLTAELRRGISPSYIAGGGVRVLNQKCIRNRQIDFAPARRHDPNRRSVEGRQVSIGDVLVNSTGVGTLGRVAQLWDLDEPTVADSHITVVRSDAALTSPVYLGIDLTGREAEIEALGEGSTGQTELARARLAKLKILKPAISIQDEFTRAAQSLLNRMTSNNRESRSLAQMRDLLLPKLMSGEIRVKDAEKIAAAA